MVYYFNIVVNNTLCTKSCIAACYHNTAMEVCNTVTNILHCAMQCISIYSASVKALKLSCQTL